MSEKRIKVTIDLLGNTKVEAVGFNGCGCTEATAPIERALGGKADRTLKDEYHASGTAEGEIHQTW